MNSKHKKNTDPAVSSGEVPRILPVLPLRDTVAFPGNTLPLTVGRKTSIEALRQASLSGPEQGLIFLVAQKDAADEDPQQSELYNIGTVARIFQQDKLANGYYRILVENLYRCRIVSMEKRADGYAVAQVSPFKADEDSVDPEKLKTIATDLANRFMQIVAGSAEFSEVVQSSLTGVEEPEKIFNTIANHLYSVKVSERQKMLELPMVSEQLSKLDELIDMEMSTVSVERKLRNQVKSQMEQSQREFYLNEKLKAIQKELGEISGGENEFEQLEKRLHAVGMPVATLEKALSDLNRFKMMMPMSAEASVMRSYLDWLINVPWKKRSRLQGDLKSARKILDQDHYGLENIKERILEFLAVQRRVRKMRSPILCFVGPPGVGKTSLGKSIARATKRQFVRLSLGGVRDEAEIRGHRKTYIGALPGKIIQKMCVAGTKNPLFLLDEIDKLGMDYRGDPASALLEVLDPEQNHTFNDHYLEVDYDLSEIMFICTANTMDIPEPLLDRMEIIRLPGYTEDEKSAICRNYLLPRQMKNTGLGDKELMVSDSAILDTIRYYTKEAGVRNLERELSKICRKVVLAHTETNAKKSNKKVSNVRVSSQNLAKYCGVRRYSFGRNDEMDQIGKICGLAWTSTGGELLTIEAAMVPGKARQVLTGSLGDVMKESIQIAMTVVRKHAASIGIEKSFMETTDVHVHVPEGAIPKDGPSAGVCMCMALISVLRGIPIRADVAMTGELTLQGQVLPIGGLKEKLLAARRGSIKRVVIPEGNRRHLAEIPDKIKKNLQIECVSSVEEIFPLVLQYVPAAMKKLGTGRRRQQVRPN